MASGMAMGMSMGMGMGMAMGMAGPGSATPPEQSVRWYALDFFVGPAEREIDFPRTIHHAKSTVQYADALWHPDVMSATFLAEFMEKGDWMQLDRDPEFQRQFLTGPKQQPFWIDDTARVECELKLMSEMMQQQRAIYFAEIYDQADRAPFYWIGLLGLNRTQHPNTLLLMSISGRIGELVAMHYKKQFKRPRPSTLMPGLVPPFGPPGHASFPSGHATQSMLLSLCLMAATGWGNGKNKPPYGDELCWLARRVAINREFGGFHYASDTAAGFLLAKQTFAILLRGTEFKEVLKAAIKENGVPDDDLVRQVFDSNWTGQPQMCPDEPCPCAPAKT
jgi:PAP2 superfamily